ncbi:MAG TPA: hypothetical protein VEG60_17775 [Candidatus Binatia bacterium]|nr:hypothetical protein [Candidatus Binatia bacterium]
MRLLNTRYSPSRDRLVQRRKVVMQTLDYLEGERNIVDANQQWKNPSVQHNRRRLLDQIHDWYDEELKKIDMTLDRLNQPSNRLEK